MSRSTPPLFGSDWNDDWIKEFELQKNKTLNFPSDYEDAEATFALMTLKVLNAMIPGQPTHKRSALVRIQELTIDIVCRRLLRAGENSDKDPTSPDMERFIRSVESWTYHERWRVIGGLNPDQLRRLDDALRTAQNDRKAMKRARRAGRC